MARRTPQHQLDDLDLRRVMIELLRPDPDNARTHSKANLNAIEASLRAHGQRKPIVVTSDMTVVAGNGTLSVMTDRLGWDSVWVSVFPGTAAEARAFGIADNRTGELAEWDEQLLTAALLSIRSADETLLAATGYPAVELERMLAQPVADLLPRERPAERDPWEYATPTQPVGRETRTLMMEFPAHLFTWLVEALASYRTERGLPDTAAAFTAMVEEFSGTPAPPEPSGVIPG